MNREILFRGKRPDNGEWHEGLLLTNKIGTYIITEKNPHECHQNGYIEIDEYCRVSPETVGQFTGLLDKEGNRIFEGDICSVLFTPQNTSYHGNYPRQYVCKVEIQFIGYQFMAFNISTKSARNSRNWNAKYIGASEFSEFEVIGNIHDNPTK